MCCHIYVKLWKNSKMWNIFPPFLHISVFTSSSFNTKYYFFHCFCQLVGTSKYLKIVIQKKRHFKNIQTKNLNFKDQGKKFYSQLNCIKGRQYFSYWECLIIETIHYEKWWAFFIIELFKSNSFLHMTQLTYLCRGFVQRIGLYYMILHVIEH